FLFEPVDDGQLAVKGNTFLLSGHLVGLASFNGKGFVALARAGWGYEPLLFVLSACGAVLAIVRCIRRARSSGFALALAPELARDPDDCARDVAVVLGFAVPFALVIGMYEW